MALQRSVSISINREWYLPIKGLSGHTQRSMCKPLLGHLIHFYTSPSHQTRYLVNTRNMFSSQFRKAAQASLFKPCSWSRLQMFYIMIQEKYLRNCSAIIVNIARQCHAIAAQRIRRTVQITSLYSKLGYRSAHIKGVMEGLRTQFLQCGQTSKQMLAVFGASIFAWHKEKISDEEMNEVSDEINNTKWSSSQGTLQIDDPELVNSWEKIIERKHLVVWRKPIPNSYLYEYKVFGTFGDIPARAFFNAQVDHEHRKSWDRLIIKLDVIDKDEASGCDVVRWIMHYPYPMYPREYVYVRRTKIDPGKKLMTIVSRSVQHPLCPFHDAKYVRVHTYLSEMVIRPHASFDENGFDYILTYYDDPKAAFPSLAYKWMASTGVPDFVDKMHNSAVNLQERSHRKRDNSYEQKQDNTDKVTM